MHSSRAGLVAALVCVSCVGCSSEDSASEPSPSEAPIGTTFQELNGVMWFYTTVNDTKYTELEASLDDWKARGIRTLGIYSPYKGDKEQWLGAGPNDYYDVPPQNGTLAELRSLVNAAHERDMKIIAFMGFHSLDEQSTFFTTAEAQYAAGDKTSREVSAFHWTDNPNEPTPTPAPMGPSAWKHSEVANAYYWGLWDNAGLDVNVPGAVSEMQKAMTFWLDVGLDGFMLDSGVVEPGFRSLWVDLPLSHEPDFWLTFESTWSEEAESFDEFGLTSWFAFEDNDYANTYSLVTFPEDGETAISPDDLEEELRRVDRARDKGKLTHAWSLLERAYPDDRMRVQEAALLAGAGVMYGAPMYHESYVSWPETVRTDWERVLATVNAHSALWPSASRERVSASGGRVYAMLRTAKDGFESALFVYNFEDHEANVTLELDGSKLDLGNTPADLHAGGHVAPFDGASYTLTLPAYGFAILQVSRVQP